jgi:small subunit ribosomal protein S6
MDCCWVTCLCAFSPGRGRKPPKIFKNPVDKTGFSAIIERLYRADWYRSLPQTRFAAICPKGGANNMAKISEKYEALYIINPQLTEEDTQALVEKFKAMVEAEGTLIAIDEWGKRRLAYPIEDLNEGYYVLMNFEAKPELPAELDRVMKITDGIMRCLITTVEA